MNPIAFSIYTSLYDRKLHLANWVMDSYFLSESLRVSFTVLDEGEHVHVEAVVTHSDEA